jgi:hypothetical protein
MHFASLRQRCASVAPAFDSVAPAFASVAPALRQRCASVAPQGGSGMAVLFVGNPSHQIEANLSKRSLRNGP